MSGGRPSRDPASEAVPSPCAGCPRRQLLAGLLAGAALAACGDRGAKDGAEDSPTSESPPGDSGAACAVDPEAVDVETWVEIPLAAHPELATVGGVSPLYDPDHLLDALLIHVSPGCYVAAWRICTHGACPLAWDAGAEELWCDCHGSRFDTEGAILEGPAERALRTFPVARVGESLWLDRGL